MATSCPTSWTLTGSCMWNELIFRERRKIRANYGAGGFAFGRPGKHVTEMNPPRPPGLPRIGVVGAGFAGLKFVQEFPDDLAQITIIDRQNHHLFQPLLYQVATAGLSAVDIAQPVRALFGARPNLNVLMSEVTKVDLAAKRILHARGEL